MEIPAMRLAAGQQSSRTVETPEQVIEEITMRSTLVGPVLEAILQEPHAQVRWGLNE